LAEGCEGIYSGTGWSVRDCLRAMDLQLTGKSAGYVSYTALAQTRKSAAEWKPSESYPGGCLFRILPLIHLLSRRARV
jgi:hypothetical protein